MSAERAARRRAERAHSKRAHLQAARRRALSNLGARHGRASFVFDFETHEIVAELDPVVGPATPFVGVWPDGRPGSDSVSMMLGCVPPEGVLEWCDNFEPPVPLRSSRLLVSAGCEHVRDQIVAQFGWGDEPGLQDLFDANPTGWLVWALMLIDSSLEHDWSRVVSGGGAS